LGLYKQVSEFEEGPRFLNEVGFDPANNRPIYTFAAPAASSRGSMERILQARGGGEPVAVGHAGRGEV
jgi:hypothetical protein